VQRQTLYIAIVALSAIGVVVAGTAFVNSLRPSERSIARRVALELPLPVRASAVLMDGKRARLILVHAPDGKVRAFSIPLIDGKVPRPDGLSWNFLNGTCVEFGVFPDANRLTSSSVIRCVAPHDFEFRQPDLDWTLSGQIITRASRTYELPQVHVQVSGQYAQISTWDRS